MTKALYICAKFPATKNTKCKHVSRLLKTPFDYLMTIHIKEISIPYTTSGLWWLLITPTHTYILHTHTHTEQYEAKANDRWTIRPYWFPLL